MVCGKREDIQVFDKAPLGSHDRPAVFKKRYPRYRGGVSAIPEIPHQLLDRLLALSPHDHIRAPGEDIPRQDRWMYAADYNLRVRASQAQEAAYLLHDNGVGAGAGDPDHIRPLLGDRRIYIPAQLVMTASFKYGYLQDPYLM